MHPIQPIRRRPGTIARLAAGALLLMGLAAATAQTAPGEEEAALLARGRVTYRIYCTSCHGAKGKGDGKLAGFLSYPPADLTRLGQAAPEGQFPAEQVRAAVDGRTMVPGHGAGDMPAWGKVFQELARPDQDPEQEAQRRIRELVAFLKSLQEAG